MKKSPCFFLRSKGFFGFPARVPKLPLRAAAGSFSNACQISFALGGRQKVDPRHLLAESALMKFQGNCLEFPAASKLVRSLGH
jgi:hypothetical protein